MLKSIAALPSLATLHLLNETNARELSSTSEAGFAALIDAAFYANHVEEAAMLIAFDQDASYDSPNFLWFKKHFRRFVYIDRVVVADTHRRRGLARQLYEDLFHEAGKEGHQRVVCEVNSNPPNPASDRFHHSLGFGVIGEASLQDKGKTVRYFERSL